MNKEQHVNEAVNLLTHYFELAGVMKDADNYIEIREAVNHIVSACELAENNS